MKYIDIGKPFDTEAVINYQDIQEDSSALKDINMTLEVGKDIQLSYKLSQEDMVYGLGENMRGINKRGGIYDSFCTDDASQVPDRTALYGAHNFFILDGKETFGIFIDFPTKVTFDIGFTHPEELKITIHGSDVRIFTLTGSKRDISKNFLKAIGRSFLPPKWAFGYQQSRWSYETADDIKAIKEQFNAKDIPLDTIYMDIDYMEEYKNFTVSEDRFPDFHHFIQEMKNDHIRLIPIIDAGCKIEESYHIHEEGIKDGYYCVDDQGGPFVGAVWPGKVHFPDFLNKDTRQWFGNHYSKFIDLGIEGFWNDMNEPAIFYTNRGMNEAIDYAKGVEGKNLGIHEFFTLKDKFVGMANNDKDYKAFYHKVDDQLYNHYDLHNLYGYNMTRAAGQAFRDNHPDKRILLFSRASYIGMHRYGGIWTGDNHAWWEHLLLNIKMMPSLNLCGFMYSGADVGGFGTHTSGELLIRWSQFAVFTPLFRNHSALGTRDQEPTSFDSKSQDILRHILKFRNAFASHLYSSYMKANENYDLLFKPLSFVYDDPFSKQVEDQLIQENLMLLPVYNQNARGRYVYLPEDFLIWSVQSFETYDLKIYDPGHHYIDVELNEMLMGIQKNSLVVLTPPENRIDLISLDTLTCIGYLDTEARYDLYTDDGISFKDGQHTIIKMTYDGKINIQIENPVCKSIIYDVLTSDKKRHKGVYYV